MSDEASPSLESPAMETLFSADAEAFRKACATDLAAAREALASFKSMPGEGAGPEAAQARLAAFDGVGHSLNRTAGLVHLFFQVHPSQDMREAAAEVEQELGRFGTELSLDREVNDRLAALRPEDLGDPIARRVLEHGLRDFRRAGVDRDEPTRVRLKELSEELIELGQDFARNISSDVREVVLDSVDDLEGLPPDFVAAHAPDAEGRVHITTNPPDYMPFQKFAVRREHRAALHRVNACRGAPANFDVLEKLLARRHEFATLLGFPSWAAYVTEDKMIRTAERAGEFIQRVADLTAQRAEQELQELTEELRSDGTDDVLRDYDRAHLTERMRNKRFAYDSRDVRPYLAYDRVRDGVIDTICRLYDIEIQRRTEVTTWHPEVESYEILEDGQVVARFYLDMHPREDKYKHAAMFDLGSGLLGPNGALDLPSACLVCNMAKPSDGNPGLLDPGDAQTLFHEFGHLMHHLLAGRHRWLVHSGIATEWDFVEVPSQLFEEWSRDVDVLQGFARHHETDEPIPTDLVERMNRASDYGKGLSTRAQMFYAGLSLEYYSRDPAGRDTTEVMKEVRARFLAIPHEPGTSLQTSFGHLDGYTALYYTYMWSLVLAKDCLSVFGNDLMNREVADHYRAKVLAPGGSRDAEDLVRDFLGRPFSFDAFEAWLAA
jgi:thimet oligopeptidase